MKRAVMDKRRDLEPSHLPRHPKRRRLLAMQVTVDHATFGRVKRAIEAVSPCPATARTRRRRARLAGCEPGSPRAGNRPAFTRFDGRRALAPLYVAQMHVPMLYADIAADLLNLWAADPAIESPRQRLDDAVAAYLDANRHHAVPLHPVHWINSLILDHVLHGEPKRPSCTS